MGANQVVVQPPPSLPTPLRWGGAIATIWFAPDPMHLSFSRIMTGQPQNMSQVGNFMMAVVLAAAKLRIKYREYEVLRSKSRIANQNRVRLPFIFGEPKLNLIECFS
ncbi:hypothetical protein FUA23_05055 [Neolewinella aurantiaca]|uniref:Uncharacterized protein n=1 Tax=Neolewinella aurantiaca TaxID=2602767 RepID=A0A5C7FS10_9BACT|nr:hypothetical protein [Neolewinella aurantiaca]TXF90810.1 hypothetical protein FUA23_05055 [Neolewinella aurantiaca]